MPSGKYLAATMELWLPKLEAFGELDTKRLTPAVRVQLMQVSGATIDRLLKPTKDAAKPKGISATKAGPLLRNSITVRNGAHKWVLAAMDEVLVRLPFPLVVLDTDNGGEFINHALIKWAGEKDIYFTRARPYKSNDNAHVEQKNGDVVRRHAFHYRYDTAAELKLLNTLYALVRVRLNLFTATTKATGWRSNKHGKKTRIYDKPRTPYQRVIDSGILTKAKAVELAELMETTNPADLTRGITAIQTQLIAHGAAKTRALEASSTRAEIVEARTTLARAS